MIVEKGIDTERNIEIDGHFGLTYSMLIDFLNGLPKNFKDQVKQKLVAIDFMNGDIFHFLKHLANGMVKSI